MINETVESIILNPDNNEKVLTVTNNNLLYDGNKNQLVDEVKDGSEATNSESNKHSTHHPTSPSNTTEDEEEEEDVPFVEESPGSRWQKRRETVAQRDIPGIDASYLAMDTEEGVEVVWNEVLFSEKKISPTQQYKVNEVFSKLIELNHQNIVKFHGYWQDRTKIEDKPRVVFITEYMSSGSLKLFLRKTKRTKQGISRNSWRRWCIQLLSALNYLHSCQQPIIHGNLTCDTIFIQNTGLVKIGSIHYLQLKAFETLGLVAPDVLHHHVKSIPDSTAKNLHFQAPEMAVESSPITTAVDIYSLGMVTLEMINLDLGGNGDTHAITEEVVNEALESLEDPVQKDLVLQCLCSDPIKRPTARELLFHPALFEIPSLKLLAVHSLVDDLRGKPDRSMSSTIQASGDKIFAEILHKDGSKPTVVTLKDCPSFELDKLLEDVQNGLYPLTAYSLLFPRKRSSTVENISFHTNLVSSNNMPNTNSNPDIINTSTANKARGGNTIERSLSSVNDGDHQMPSMTSLSNSSTETTKTQVPIDFDKENRRIIDIQCKLKIKDTGLCLLFISVKFQDRLQRDMTAEIDQDETPDVIAKELLELGLIHESDYARVEQSIIRTLSTTQRSNGTGGDTNTMANGVTLDGTTATGHALQSVQLNTNGPVDRDTTNSLNSPLPRNCILSRNLIATSLQCI
ncbi:unnamed protein product [Didymodactylos carnosus]|uniref:Protein kinase domain-containing protein n=1 Tax=Didymodactylos carnosus TaxID=1234261 RepID=A0A813QKA7_9BILA|nr:unnamed protein product [Didymodactylos carnosus]CAF0908282.1 unnamed protein product [Didymodactylos carnosus]CAF3550831.1 unnamed protein product [Didymodactylos carnosus]CAF3687782.1 unnamed protein product [Didymodactylos carnosus]